MKPLFVISAINENNICIEVPEPLILSPKNAKRFARDIIKIAKACDGLRDTK